jgi:hypothetical protein
MGYYYKYPKNMPTGNNHENAGYSAIAEEMRGQNVNEKG